MGIFICRQWQKQINDKLQRGGELPIPFVGSCDGNVMSKVTQYVTNDAKIC
jgi:hypothetical protein